MNKTDLFKLAVLIIIIDWHNRQRERYTLHRSALVPPSMSPWKRLLYHADDHYFLTITGFVRSTFNQLESKIFYSFSTIGVKRGCPSSLNNHDKLGLYLIFLGSAM